MEIILAVLGWLIDHETPIRILAYVAAGLNNGWSFIVKARKKIVEMKKKPKG